jgi:hypothetical protein
MDWNAPLGEQTLGRQHDALKKALSECLDDMPTTPIDTADTQQLIACCIFATILQTATECVDLMERATSVTCVGGMVRSSLESYADLCALIKDENYVLRMTATFFSERRRLARNMRASQGSNPHHETLAKTIDANKEFTEMTARLSEMRDMGIRPLRNDERFAAAGLQHIYESLYFSLSLDAHNNITALQDRHFGEKNGRLQIMVFKDNRRGQLAMYYDTLLTVVIDCASRLHAFLKSPRAKHYARQGVELAKFKKETFGFETPGVTTGTKPVPPAAAS